MKRRGNLAHLPTPKRGLPPRLGGRPARAFTPPQATSPGDVPLDEIDVYEDQSQDAAAMACEEDIGPPESSLPGRLPFQQLSTNIMGVNYRDDLNGEEDFDAGDTENAEDIGADIVFEKEIVVEEEPGDEIVGGGVEAATAPIETVAMETETSLIDTTATPNTEPSLEEEDPKRRAVEETVADGPAENSKNSAVNDFHIAMMLFVTSSDISRSQYTALTEVLALATVEGLRTLPRSIKTLRENTRRSFPLSQIKARPVGVNLDVTPPKTEDPRLAYYFDTTEYCKLWLSDPKIRHNLHMDMGVIVDNPTELWHGDAWMESVRSTSGVFAKIGEQGSSSRAGSAGAGASENILLPSDCIKYRDSTREIVYARVKAIGIDGRKTPQGTYPTQRSYLAVVNRLLPVSHVPAEFDRGPLVNDAYPSYPSGLPELVLFESRDIIPCSSILSKEWGYFTDYESPESLRNSLLPYPPTFCVRKIVYSHLGRPFTRPVHKRHRLAAENELIYLTREYVLNTLVAKEGAVRRHMSVPFSTFLDGFGLYRNAYHSLKGMYITPAGLDYNSRSQMANMFVLMLGPFGSNELEMSACLKKDSETAGRGFEANLQNGDSVFITAFPLLFTGDLPQQNQNAGNKTHNAEYGCRYCFVHDSARGDLLQDVLLNGRYRAPTKMLYQAAMEIGTKSGRAAALQKVGLTVEGPYFTRCYPMLDPRRSNPNDPMHAELRLCKYFSEALIDGMLSPAGIVAYREAWNEVDVPYGWGQPQNPVSHKGSMVFSEHGRMAIMNPFVLMHLFSNESSKHHTHNSDKPYLKAGIESRIKSMFYSAGTGARQLSARLYILQTSYTLAKTVHLTLKKSLTREEQKKMYIAVYQMRMLLRQFFKSTGGGKGSFQKYADVPNIHLGLHYSEDVINFATTFNATTAMGEQKHKVFKQHAGHTNSHETDLQLLKLINTTQTIRFLLDDTFPDLAISKQVQNIVKKCPTLKVRFLGRALAEADQDDSTAFDIDVKNSLFLSAKTSRPLTLKSISNKENNLQGLKQLYKAEHNVDIDHNMRARIHYWHYFTGKPHASVRVDGQHDFRVVVGGFVRLLRENNPVGFYRVNAIFTLTIGSLRRPYFSLTLLQRVEAEEVELTPFPVLKLDPAGSIVVVGIKELYPEILHFVKKSDDSWWYNPFVPHFI